MGKPQNSVYQEFTRRYKAMNETLGKKQYLVPYLMSSHPGSTMKDAVALAEYLRDQGYNPEQVQDFLSDTVNAVDLYVLHRLRSPDDEEGICAAFAPGKGDAKSTDPVPESEKL